MKIGAPLSTEPFKFTLEDIITQLMSGGELIHLDFVKENIMAVNTPWGVRDLTQLNHRSFYEEKEYPLMEFSMDLNLAYLLGLIDIEENVKTINPFEFFPMIKRHNPKSSLLNKGYLLVSWLQWASVNHEMKMLIEQGMWVTDKVRLIFKEVDGKATFEATIWLIDGSSITHVLRPLEAEGIFLHFHPGVKAFKLVANYMVKEFKKSLLWSEVKNKWYPLNWFINPQENVILPYREGRQPQKERKKSTLKRTVKKVTPPKINYQGTRLEYLKDVVLGIGTAIEMRHSLRQLGMVGEPLLTQPYSFTLQEIFQGLVDGQELIRLSDVDESINLQKVQTPWGVRDLTQLNHKDYYTSKEFPMMEFSMDLDIAYQLGLINITDYSVGISPRKIYPKFKEIPCFRKTIDDSIVLNHVLPKAFEPLEG